MNPALVMHGVNYLAESLGEQITDERKAIYVKELSDLKNEGAFADAVDVLVNAAGRFPKIVDFREAYFSALSRQPKHEALSAGGESEDQRRDRFEWQAAQAQKIVDMLAANGGSLVRDMNDPGSWPKGEWRRKNCIEQPYKNIVYEAPEPAGGISPTRRPPFGDRS